MLGLLQVKSWATLLSLSKMAEKPNALSVLAMTRAKMCQLLADCFTNPSNSDAYFTTGLLSNLDAFFDVELKEIIGSMPLSQVVVDGLMEGVGSIGLVLKTVVSYEKANRQDIDWEALAKLNIGARELESSYRESIRWASQLGSVVGNA